MNLEKDEILKIREVWGDKPCTHPRLITELQNGRPTLNQVCSTCGKIIYLNSGDDPEGIRK